MFRPHPPEHRQRTMSEYPLSAARCKEVEPVYNTHHINDFVTWQTYVHCSLRLGHSPLHIMCTPVRDDQHYMPREGACHRAICGDMPQHSERLCVLTLFCMLRSLPASHKYWTMSRWFLHVARYSGVWLF